MKKAAIIIGIILVGFLGWRFYTMIHSGLNAGAKKMGRPPVAVQVADVTHEPLREVHQFTGTVYPIYQYVLAPKVSGRIVEIRKRIGDPVRKGEVLARIDDAEYQQAVLEAEANLKIAQASLVETKGQAELAKQELERAQSLQEKGIASSAELDAAVSSNTASQARLKLAQAQVDQREAALNSAKIRLEYTVLTAPEPGYVGERFVDEGSLLSPSSPVLTVVGIDRIIVRTTIIERDYGRMHPGQDAMVEVDAFQGEQFPGKVARIAPMLQESSRVANTEVDVDNGSHKLKPGMFARVNVVLASNDNAQVVPTQALVSNSGSEAGSGVFMVTRNSPPVAKFVPVEVGITTADKTEIISPVLEGKVVTIGQHLLTDGSPVVLPGKGQGGKDREMGRGPDGAPGSDMERGQRVSPGGEGGGRGAGKETGR